MNKNKIIRSIKQDANKLHLLIKEINNVWPSAELDIIETLVQNLAFESSATSASSKDQLEEIDRIVKALRAFERYNSYHITKFIADEVEQIVSSAYFVDEAEEGSPI